MDILYKRLYEVRLQLDVLYDPRMETPRYKEQVKKNRSTDFFHLDLFDFPALNHPITCCKPSTSRTSYSLLYKMSIQSREWYFFVRFQQFEIAHPIIGIDGFYYHCLCFFFLYRRMWRRLVSIGTRAHLRRKSGTWTWGGDMGWRSLNLLCIILPNLDGSVSS